MARSTQYRGSSPHARGLPSVAAGGAQFLGIIPARAGFTRGSVFGASEVGDHPRTRGVYSRRRIPNDHPQGSSPHARGLPSVRRGEMSGRGIIPARAGFTPGPEHPPQLDGDHPRTRGVYPAFAVVCDGVGGSSPHARGLPGVSGVLHGPVGIIPARAGFTRYRRHAGGKHRDHPRTRGVYRTVYRPVQPLPGSSPHARGLPLLT